MVTMPCTVRDAQLKDLPRIVEIYNASIPTGVSTADLSPVSVESRIEWFKKHTSDHHPIWVSEEGGSIIAWIDLHPFREKSAYDRSAEFSLYVDPRFKGRGIGESLLRRMMQYCPALGIDVLVGLIFAHNMPSLGLARKMGFKRWGYLYGITIIDGKRRDVVIMGLKIKPKRKSGS